MRGKRAGGRLSLGKRDGEEVLRTRGKGPGEKVDGWCPSAGAATDGVIPAPATPPGAPPAVEGGGHPWGTCPGARRARPVPGRQGGCSVPAVSAPCGPRPQLPGAAAGVPDGGTRCRWVPARRGAPHSSPKVIWTLFPRLEAPTAHGREGLRCPEPPPRAPRSLRAPSPCCPRSPVGEGGEGCPQCGSRRRTNCRHRRDTLGRGELRVRRGWREAACRHAGHPGGCGGPRKAWECLVPVSPSARLPWAPYPGQANTGLEQEQPLPASGSAGVTWVLSPASPISPLVTRFGRVVVCLTQGLVKGTKSSFYHGIGTEEKGLRGVGRARG